MFGGCYALWAYLRMLYCALVLAVFSGVSYDIIVCDQARVAE